MSNPYPHGPYVFVCKWLFYWAAWTSDDPKRTCRSFTREGAIGKAKGFQPQSYKWERVQ